MEVELNPREAAFLLDEIVTNESRRTSVRHEAQRIRSKAEKTLTE